MEAIYTDVIGREVFRELVIDAGCGSPTAVRHRDGFRYLLVAESDHRVVYRQAAGPLACGDGDDGRTSPAAVQDYFTN